MSVRFTDGGRAKISLHGLSDVEATRDARQIDLANGLWDNSPIELIVYGFEDQTFPVVKVLRNVLLDIDQIHDSEDAERLVVRQVDRELAARVSWDCSKWGDEFDLVKGMASVKSKLQERGYEVFWANTAGKDLRATVRFATTCNFGNDRLIALEHGRDRTTWVRRACSEELYKDIADFRVIEGNPKRDSEVNVVEIDFRRPSSADKMESFFATEDRRQWFEAKAGIKDFHRVRSHIPIEHPAMIASPGRSHDGPGRLLSGLDKWVAEYNAAFQTTETLLPWDDGSRGKFVFETNFVVIPSSVGLAQFLTQQEPRAGFPYELLYDLNGHCLMPASQVEAMLEVERLQEVRLLHKRLQSIQKELLQVRWTLARWVHMGKRVAFHSRGWLDRDFTAALLEDYRARALRSHGMPPLSSDGDLDDPTSSDEEMHDSEGQLDVALQAGEQHEPCSDDESCSVPHAATNDDHLSPSSVSTARALWQAILANGTHAGSPIQLMVVDLPFDIQEPKLAFMSEVLQSLGQDSEDHQSIDWRHLVLSEEPNPGYDGTRIRLSWAEEKWMDDVNLVDEMGAVREALQNAGYEVFWANAATDLRNVAEFEMRDGSYDVRPDLGCPSFKWLYDHCVNAGVEPVDASGTRSCYQYCKYRLTFRYHLDVDTLETYFESQKPPYGGEPVVLHRPQINVTYPTTIASPGRQNTSSSYLLAEIERWVAAYNSKHRTSEGLLHVKDDRRWEMAQGHFIVKPSSIHLAEYLTCQTPRFGQKYELLYVLNGREEILPAAEAQAAVETAVEAAEREENRKGYVKQCLDEIRTDMWHIRYTVQRVIPDFWSGGAYVAFTPEPWDSDDDESMASWSSEEIPVLG